MNNNTRTARLITWLKSPLRAKQYSILIRALCAARQFDGELLREAYFDSLDPEREFSIANRGNEKYVVLNSDRGISKILFVKGSFDFDKVEKALSIMKTTNRRFKLETLIDIGANIGTVCIPAIKRGLAASAVAFEPEPLNHRVLVANVFLNDLADKINVYNLALGAENNQTLRFELLPGSGEHRVYTADESESPSEHPKKLTTVKSETFDSIVPAVDKCSHLVWMDTQGYEGIILQGARKITQGKVPTVIEFWPEGMKRMGSYLALKTAMLNYSEYYDLAAPNPRPIKISDASIDNLYGQLGEVGHWTDILLV